MIINNIQQRLLTSLLTLCLASFISGCSVQESKVQKRSSDIGGGEKLTASSAKLLTATELAPYQQRDIQDEVFYFVLPDRFNNGDSSNDKGSTTQAISAGGFDKSSKAAYHGGDIKGLQNKIPYIKGLGATAIWLTPILRNQAVQGTDSGYHGYWVLDFTEIDPHLGSNEDLKRFIDAAHQENIKVYFDIIANHTADVIKFKECHGEDGLGWIIKDATQCPYKSLAQVASGDSYTTVIPKGSENVKTPAWLNDPKYYHNQGDSTWQGENSIYGDFVGLDDINTDDPEVVKGLTDIFKNIISEFKPDGFRIDTVKHVNIEFWSDFSPALVNHAKSIGIDNFFMFGEVYDGNSKVLSKYTTIGNMQSVLDFGFQGAIYDLLINQTGTNKLAELIERDSDYLDHDSNANQLLNFIGNHDMGRFAHMLKNNNKDMNEQEIIDRTLLAHAMMYFVRGVPVIYYGDEQGFVGDGGDQDSRQNMMPSQVISYNDDDLLATDKTTANDNFDTSHPFYIELAKYADIYHQYPGLRHGQHKSLYQQQTPGIYAFSRTIAANAKSLGFKKELGLDEVENLVIFNTAITEQTVSFLAENNHYITVYQDSGGNHKVDLNENEVTVTVPALSFTIYQAK